MKKSIILLSIFFLGINQINAQQQNNTNYKRNTFDISSNLFTSPEVTQFQKSTFFESNNYVGKIDLKVPIYNIKHGDISVPIYLNYNSSGIKIDDISSDVGMGWSLIAGGNIIRNIKDLKDNTNEVGRYSVEDWDIGWDTYEFDSQIGYVYYSMIGYEDFIRLGYSLGEFAKVDASPDLYYISAPDVNSSFYFKKEKGLNAYYAVQLSGKDLLFNTSSVNNLNHNQIGFDNRTIRGLENLHNVITNNGNPFGTPIQIKDNINLKKPDFTQIEFKNSKGIYYNFNQYDVIETISNVLNVGKSIWALPQAFPFGYQSYPTTWHLSEIKDYNDKKVEFDYDVYTNPYVKKTREKSNDLFRASYNPFAPKNWTDGCDFGLYPTFRKVQNNVISYFGEVREDHYKAQEFYSIQSRKNRLKKIKWENNTIEFIHNTNRIDNPNEKSLDEIIIRNGDIILKKIKFYYSYFNSLSNCSEWQCYRLKLDKIEEVDSNNEPINRYKFDYDYDIPLPNVYSSQQDFLGYYNGNNVEQSNDLDNKVPTLYFHKNQGKFSILPFKRLDGTFTKIIPGQFSLTSNNYSLTGLLKKVTFPTGGTSEFEYENHNFLFNGVEYIAGGARIKKQKIDDGIGNNRILNYEYSKDGKSSGTINNIPVFGQIWGFDPRNTDLMTFVSFDKPKNEIELTDGAFVGYSNVKVYEQGNGYTEYNFTTSKEYPNQEILNTTKVDPYDLCTNTLHKNSSFPNVAYIDNDVRRGKLLSSKIYNSSNVLLQSQNNEFKHTIFSEEIIPFQRFINNYADNPYNTKPEGFITTYENKIRVERNLLTKQEIKDYLNGSVITNTKEITYDDILPFVKQEKNYNSKGETITTEYKYSADLASNTNSIWDKMVERNMIATPVETKVSNNTTVLSEQRTKFNYYPGTNNTQLILPQYVYTKKGAMGTDVNNEDRKITYNRYDDKGNLTQYTVENGIPVSIIWGYNGQYPIAKIEGASFDLVSSFENDLKTASNSNSLTKTSFDALRNAFPNALVTGYIYKPLVGVTMIIQPNGIAEHYKYDTANRLEEIKNDQGEVLKKFEYNYAQPQ